MQKTPQSRPHTHEVKQRFDAAVAQQMKRLMETSEGAGDLPLDSVTLPCLVLLTERENDIQRRSSDAPERYTRTTLIDDLAGMGLKAAGEIHSALEEITQRGYMDMGGDGGLTARRPALALATCLDRALPGMAGMNLVAYLVQTTHEVLSGRKELDAAITQFNQTLEMHGVGLSRQEAKTAPQVRGEATQAAKGKVPSNEALRSALQETLRKRQAEKGGEPDAGPVGQSVVLTATGKVSKVEVRELFPKRDQSAEAPRVSPEDELLQGPEPPKAEPAETKTEEKVSSLAPPHEAQGPHDESSRSTGQSAETFSEHQPVEEDMSRAVPPAQGLWEAEGAEEEIALSLSEKAEREQPHATEAGLQAPHRQPDQPEGPLEAGGEGIIESRIAAFEEGLATACPLCSKGRIERKETAKGKSYYVCSNKDCVFISWGKPYHMACPQCKNPFLIESMDKTGRIILRCPRATCRHRQRPPGETTENSSDPLVSGPDKPSKPRARSGNAKRRVVRRRVVRRKH